MQDSLTGFNMHTGKKIQIAARVGFPYHKLFFFLLIFCLPLGGRLRFVLPWNQLYGRLGEYLVPEIYLTDFLVVGIIIAYVRQLRWQALWRDEAAQSGKAGARAWIPDRALLISFAVMGVGVLLAWPQALVPQVSVYRLVKLGEWGLLLWYMSRQQWDRRDVLWISLALLIGGAGQSLLAWFQFMFQTSLTSGKFAHLIGEQPISLWETGISYVWVFGQKIIRPYGTFPHPNVMAAYLAVSLLGGIQVLARIKELRWSVWARSCSYISLAVILGTIGLSLSRLVWMVLAVWGVLTAVVWRKELMTALARKRSSLQPRQRIMLLLAGATGMGALGFGMVFAWLRFATLWSYNAISLTGRVLLNDIALRMFVDHPFGVGLGNFTINLRMYDLTGLFTEVIQPVHNVFLLMLSETGLFGLAGFLLLLGSCLRILSREFATAYTAKQRLPRFLLYLASLGLLWLMFFDHFLWTLQQGQLMMWIALGFACALARTGSTTEDTESANS